MNGIAHFWHQILDSTSSGYFWNIFNKILLPEMLGENEDQILAFILDLVKMMADCDKSVHNLLIQPTHQRKPIECRHWWHDQKWAEVCYMVMATPFPFHPKIGPIFSRVVNSPSGNNTHGWPEMGVSNILIQFHKRTRAWHVQMCQLKLRTSCQRGNLPPWPYILRAITGQWLDRALKIEAFILVHTSLFIDLVEGTSGQITPSNFTSLLVERAANCDQARHVAVNKLTWRAFPRPIPQIFLTFAWTELWTGAHRIPWNW